MADGSIIIDTAIDSSTIDREVERVNRKLNGIGQNMTGIGQRMNKDVSAEFNTMRMTSSRALKGMSAEAQNMANEMREAFTAQKLGMVGLREEQLGVQHGFFKMAQGAKTYAGTTDEFMKEVETMGKRHKKVTEDMMKANELQKISFLQTVGVMMNRSTQASKISDNFDRMENPLYKVNKAGLAVADGLNKIAMRGNASVLALKMLGPTANMKSLRDMTMMINQGLMRFTQVALIAAIGAAIFYKQMHDGAMKLNKDYATAFKEMQKTVGKAFEPLIQAFAMIMTPVYKFITAIAAMIVKFNEAHPTIAKLIAAFLVIIPILTLILSPLAIGIGLFGGLSAAMGAVWMIIGPIVTGFAAMMGTVLLVAAVIVGVAAAFIYLWKNVEWFREGIISAWNYIKQKTSEIWQAIVNAIRPAIEAVITYVTAKLAVLQAFWKRNGETIVNMAKLHFNNIWLIIKGVMGYVLGLFQTVWPIISNAVKIAWNLIKLVIDSTLDIIVGLLKAGMALMKGDWKGAWTAIKDIAKNIWKNIEQFFKNIDLRQIGKDIIAGLIKGIGSMANAVKDTIGGIVGNIKKGITGAFSIKSPSKWMEKKVGKWLPAGIAVGIDKNQRPLERSINGMASKIGYDSRSAMGVSGTKGTVTNSSTTHNNSPVTVHLQYNGNNPSDGAKMVDMVEREMNRRFGRKAFMRGASV